MARGSSYPQEQVRDGATTHAGANFSSAGSYDPKTGRSASAFSGGEGAGQTHASPLSPKAQVGRPFAARDRRVAVPPNEIRAIAYGDEREIGLGKRIGDQAKRLASMQ